MIDLYFYISRANIYAGAQKFFDDFVHYVDTSHSSRFYCRGIWSLSSSINFSRTLRFNKRITFFDSLSIFVRSLVLSKNSDIHFSSSFLAGFLVSLVSLLLRKKHVYIVHGVLSSRVRRNSIIYYFYLFFDWLLFLVARNLVFIAPCDYYYAHNLPFVQSKVKSILINNSISPLGSDFVYPFTSLSSYLATHDIILPSSVTCNLCMTARFESQKSQPVLVESIKSLPFISVCFFGDGKSIDVAKKLAGRYQLLDRVFFLGHVDSPYLYYNLFDLFVLVSRWESMPFSLIEALRSGLPFVSSNVGSCDYLSDSGKCGEVLKYTTPDCLADLLLHLSQSKDKLSLMSRSAVDFFCRELSSSANYDKIIAFFDTL
ncbi:glycosyltransferase family 4 protein [Parasynechococcus marenigrum]|uniref:Possible glycosyltransferase group I n=1 Tax=Parasynechococcus marenigrum (strain WH8102) TaxID=84588 RepID=Q7U901_PARMW|nr:glycosyltransferase family 4 protein [Parasynechococcus marenigrum]CAE06973.1 possible glycosyltransferase group I [Parasynechococcus marenigrum WH 8102]